jgi:hypothetical protein
MPRPLFLILSIEHKAMNQVREDDGEKTSRQERKGDIETATFLFSTAEIVELIQAERCGEHTLEPCLSSAGGLLTRSFGSLCVEYERADPPPCHRQTGDRGKTNASKFYTREKER